MDINYIDKFIHHLKNDDYLKNSMNNHGFERYVNGCGIHFFPLKEDVPGFSVEITPGWGLKSDQIDNDAAKGRLLLVPKATNASGREIILNDNIRYITITGMILDDTAAYIRHVVNTLVNITGFAEMNRLSTYDYITELAIDI